MKTKIKGKVILGALTCSMLVSQLAVTGVFHEGQKREDEDYQIMSLDKGHYESTQGEIESEPISSGMVEKVIGEDKVENDSEKLLITGLVKFNDLSGGFYEVDGFRLAGDYDFQEFEGRKVKVVGYKDDSPSIFMTKAVNVERIIVIDKEKNEIKETSRVTKEIHQVENSETARTYVDLYINEESLKLDKAKRPFIKDGRTLAPFRTITENLGAKVSWDPVERLVSMQKGLIEIELVIDSSIAKVNGNVVDLDVPVTIVNDKTFVPIRFLAEALNVEIAWEPDGNIVSLDI